MSRHRPKVIAFDVLGTLFPLDPLAAQLKEAGLPAAALKLWYARTLHDGTALGITGQFKSFREVAEASLEELTAEHSIQPRPEQIEKILDGISALPPDPQLGPVLELLRSATVRTMALTNGSAESTRKMLHKAGLESLVEHIVSIDQVRAWKPARPVYLQAAITAGVETHQLALVAAHAWDIQGAQQAGLTTAWFPREEKRFSHLMHEPDIKAGTLLEAVQGLLQLPVGNHPT